jgi:hypothetical protein
MSKKVDRAVRGPGWGEVILGAVLSLVLGVVLGVGLLVLKPAVKVKELPKEADRDKTAVYYIEGTRDTAKAKQALAKRKAFVEGQSVTATEDEINSLLGATTAPAPASPTKPGEKAAPTKAGEKAAPAPAAPAETSGVLGFGAANVRIRDGVLQVGAPVTFSPLGISLVAQARGGFEKQGDVFVYEPNELYLGSCPVQRLPFVSTYVRSKFLAAQSIPEDIATAWKKVTAVAIEGNAIKVSTQ